MRGSPAQGLMAVIVLQAAMGLFCTLERPYKFSLDFFADLGVRSAICLTGVFTYLLHQTVVGNSVAGFRSYAVIWLAVMMCIVAAVIFFRGNYKIHQRRLRLQQLVQADSEESVKSLHNSFVSSCKEFELVQC